VTRTAPLGASLAAVGGGDESAAACGGVRSSYDTAPSTVTMEIDRMRQTLSAMILLIKNTHPTIGGLSFCPITGPFQTVAKSWFFIDDHSKEHIDCDHSMISSYLPA
jgi:hypothetical protein